MAKIKTIEILVKAFVDEDVETVASILNREIKDAKQKGQYNIARRLRNLLTQIPSKKTLSSQNVKGSSKEAFYLYNDSLVNKIDSQILLEDVVLDHYSRKVIADFLTEWEGLERLEKHGVQPTNKLLFYGPPGTGKTKLAYAVANKLDMPLVVVRLDELISSFLGKTGKNISEVFDIARREAVVILMDEIDTIAKHRDDVRELGELKRVVTVLLQNIDYFPSSSIIIGATNHESLLDNAIWRRFPIKLKMDIPTEEERILLFDLFLGNFKNDVSFKLLAQLSKGLTGSAINDVCQKIKKEAILTGRDNVDNFIATRALLSFIGSKEITSTSRKDKKKLYVLCKMLKANGLTLKQISEISDIPYTTLIDNIS